MNKIFILISFLLLFNSADKSEDIAIEISRDHNDRILVEWSIDIENASRVYLFIEHDGAIQEYELPSLSGQVNLCCYSGDVSIRIVVHTKQAVTQVEDCDAISCVEFIKEEFFNEAVSPGTTTTTTTIPPTTTTSTTTIPPPTTTSSSTTMVIPVSEESIDGESILKRIQKYFISISNQGQNLISKFSFAQVSYLTFFVLAFVGIFLFRNKIDLLFIFSKFKYVFFIFILTFIFVLVNSSNNLYKDEIINIEVSIDPVVISTSTTTTSLVPNRTETTSTQNTTSSPSSTSSTTTTTIPTIVGISEDSESVQIIDVDVKETTLYEGPYSSFAGYEGENQILLDQEVSNLPLTIRTLMEEKVIFINGCHEYAKSIVGRCPYGVWDSSGTEPDGSKGSEWKLSIWISNRAFEANEYMDVLLHEASHALSFLTRECLDSDNDNYRMNAWDFFGGEEKFADAVVLYYGGSYNHYRDSGPLSLEEVDFIDGYMNTCLS